jgi:hypothetical protein
MFGVVVRYNLQNVTDHGVSNCGKYKTTLRRKIFTGMKKHCCLEGDLNKKKFEVNKE